MFMSVSAYTLNNCGQWCDGYTATMTVPQEGRTVACGKSYRNQHIYLEGIGVRKCEDVGGAIGTHNVDLFMDSRKDALQWGRRDLRAFIVREEEW